MRFAFSGHIALLELFLNGRQAIVDSLERQLFGARGKAAALNGDRESIAGSLQDCFFESPASPQDLGRSDRHLDAARLADGFEPARRDRYSRELDLSELVLRACHYWNSARWPGRNGRRVFAESLYAVFMVHQLEQLSLRLWDTSTPLGAGEGNEDAAERLQHVQRLLDRVNSAHRPSLVRDARWLIQTAQGPLTRHVKPYFLKAAHVSRSFTETDRLEIHKAGALLAGGHLRSQLRHLSWQTGWAFDDPQLVALTRSSNSMDMALLVRDLVPLLDAYAVACRGNDTTARLALADAILQGLSADPELLLTRLDLLGPSTMIEDLFIDHSDAGTLPYTLMGEVHRQCLSRYGELVAATAESLHEDCRALDPADEAYSPFGIVYGFCADLFANMVLSTLRPTSSRDVTLEDMFNSRECLEEKRAQAHEWERLPKREGEPNPFEHSLEWAGQMHARLARALEARANSPNDPNASGIPKSCLYVAPRGQPIETPSDRLSGLISAQEHCLTADVTRARTTGATALPADRLAADRAEGRLLACAHSDGAWFGISKVPLTLFLSQGKDALFTDVPTAVIDILRTVCPEFLIVDDRRVDDKLHKK
jgi:hypothetical protein